MFAEYEQRPIYRRVSRGREEVAEDDPVLIESLHGSPGLRTKQTLKAYKLGGGNGWFSNPFLFTGLDTSTDNIASERYYHIENTEKEDSGIRSFNSKRLLAFDFELVSQNINRKFFVTPLNYEVTNISHNVLIRGKQYTQLLTKLEEGIQREPPKPDNDIRKNSLSDYTTLNYKGLFIQQENKEIGEDNISGIPRDFRYATTKPDLIKTVDGYTIKQIIDDPKILTNDTNKVRVVPTTNVSSTMYGDDDFIKIRIKSVSTGEAILFTAFLTSFSDSFSPSWQDLKYVGRQDTLKYFSGVTRTASIGFKVAAFNPDEMKMIYEDLDNLVKGTAVGGLTSGANSITAPYCNITLGNWFKNTTCVITSLKFDVQTADYAWDVRDNYKMPHLIDVSLDLFILGDRNGAPLNATSNTFFNVLT